MRAYELIDHGFNDKFTIELIKLHDSGKIQLRTRYNRSAIVTTMEHVSVVQPDGTTTRQPLDEHTGRLVLRRALQEGTYSSSYIINGDELSAEAEPPARDELAEDRYTSTGIKFWLHEDRLREWQTSGRTNPVSTHISPEGRCNLKCAYCSVSSRNVTARLTKSTVSNYLDVLTDRGLKAVILTGGGEPTLYPHFDWLIDYIHQLGLEIGLITNGTCWNSVSEKSMERLTWVRISLNVFPDWENRITVPETLRQGPTTVGFSYVYTQQDPEDTLDKVKRLADKYDVQYVRLLPNCLLDQPALIAQHRVLARKLAELQDPRFFQQIKTHRAPPADCSECPMGYFRPYLSEEINQFGYSGTVYSCDSVVLNNESTYFDPKYAICAAHQIEEYLDGLIKPSFSPHHDCSGCVFTRHVELLHAVRHRKAVSPAKLDAEHILHPNFL